MLVTLIRIAFGARAVFVVHETLAGRVVIHPRAIVGIVIAQPIAVGSVGRNGDRARHLIKISPRIDRIIVGHNAQPDRAIPHLIIWQQFIKRDDRSLFQQG